MTRIPKTIGLWLALGVLAFWAACSEDTSTSGTGDTGAADAQLDSQGDALVDDGPDSDGSPDADLGVDGEDVPTEAGDPDSGGEPPSTSAVTAVGGSSSIDVAAWNLREFPLRSATPELVADVIEALEVDLVVLFEIEDPTAFAALTVALRGWDGLHPTLPGGDRSTTAIVYRRDTVRTGAFQMLFTDNPNAFPRPPLQVVVQVVGTGGGAAAEVTLIGVHLKAGTTASDESRRLDAMVALEAHVRGLVDGPADDEVMVIGDFNEAIGDPDAENVFAPWTDAPDRYRVPTLTLAEGGTVTYLPAEIMLDHVVLTAALDDEIAGTAPIVPALDAQITDFELWLSDHLPLVVVAPELP